MSQRWKHRPEGSTWGDFGPDDQLGRLNLLTPGKVREGMAEVREGLRFCLGMPLTLPGGTGLNPRRLPPMLKPVYREGEVAFCLDLGRFLPGCTTVTCDDALEIHNQYSSQWDALAHFGGMFDVMGDGEPRPVFYNGFPVVDERTGRPTAGLVGAASLTVENMAVAGIQGRGVMIDLHAHFGGRHHPVGYDDLMRVLEADGVEVTPGDMACVNTGFDALLLAARGQPDRDVVMRSTPALNGRDRRLLHWITDSGVAIIASDNRAVEFEWNEPPATERPGPMLELHEHCLFKLGVHLGEMWLLGPLAAWLRERGRTRFLLTAQPLRMPGAVGSPVTPIATV
jgi:hypothetical protein